MSFTLEILRSTSIMADLNGFTSKFIGAYIYRAIGSGVMHSFID